MSGIAASLSLAKKCLSLDGQWTVIFELVMSGRVTCCKLHSVDQDDRYVSNFRLRWINRGRQSGMVDKQHRNAHRLPDVIVRADVPQLLRLTCMCTSIGPNATPHMFAFSTIDVQFRVCMCWRRHVTANVALSCQHEDCRSEVVQRRIHSPWVKSRIDALM